MVHIRASADGSFVTGNYRLLLTVSWKKKKVRSSLKRTSFFFILPFQPIFYFLFLFFSFYILGLLDFFYFHSFFSSAPSCLVFSVPNSPRNLFRSVAMSANQQQVAQISSSADRMVGMDHAEVRYFTRWDQYSKFYLSLCLLLTVAIATIIMVNNTDRCTSYFSVFGWPSTINLTQAFMRKCW